MSKNLKNIYQNYKNRCHWEKLNKEYSKNWEGFPKKKLSERETNFVTRFLGKTKGRTLLDIGVGNGRILEKLVKFSSEKSCIFGIDLSDKMADFCRKKFVNEKKIEKIIVCDVARSGICIDERFDFISAVRVLKYNKNWVDMIKNIGKKLEQDGIFVFTMLNENSLSFFSNYGLSTYQVSKKEIKEKVEELGFEMICIESFSKLPAFMYLYFIDSRAYSNLIICCEKILEFILGKNLFGKEFFIAIKKAK